jgi:hypothetical protein
LVLEKQNIIRFSKKQEALVSVKKAIDIEPNNDEYQKFKNEILK